MKKLIDFYELTMAYTDFKNGKSEGVVINKEPVSIEEIDW